MKGFSIPLWWQDILQSNIRILDGWERVLERLEAELSAPFGGSSRSVSRSTARWTALVREADEASRLLKAGMRLAEARSADIRAMGFSVPVDASFPLRVHKAVDRTRRLADAIRGRMGQIADELARREPRRPRGRVYRGEAPSHVDIHV